MPNSIQQQFHSMDDLLVFSHTRKIKCCTFLSTHQIVIADETSLVVFDVGEAKIIMQSAYGEQLHAISVWVMGNKQICIQGKMGFNYIYQCNRELETITQIHKYVTHVFGFCKMAMIGNKVLGISEQHKSIKVYDIESGNQIYTGMLEDQKYSESISCLDIVGGDKNEMTIYLGQEGCNIHKSHINICNDTEDSLVQIQDTLTIGVKQQIKILTCLQFYDTHLYAIIRKQPSLYIISTHPKLAIKQIINFNLSAPKQIKILQLKSDKQIIVSDKNKIHKINLEPQSITQLLQIKQSKSIQYFQVCPPFGICGNTEEKQFFHFQI